MVDVTTALSLFTTHVISGYCLGENLGLVAQRGWEPNFREPLYAQLKLVYLFRFFPWMRHLGFAMAMYGSSSPFLHLLQHSRLTTNRFTADESRWSRCRREETVCLTAYTVRNHNDTVSDSQYSGCVDHDEETTTEHWSRHRRSTFLPGDAPSP